MVIGYTTKRGCLIEYDNFTDKVVINYKPYTADSYSVVFDRKELLDIMHSIEKEAANRLTKETT